MTKAELIDKIKGDMTKKDAGAVLEALFKAIGDSLKEEGKFAYPGFGSFAVRERQERKGKSPKDPTKVIIIPARKTVVFRPATALKETL